MLAILGDVCPGHKKGKVRKTDEIIVGFCRHIDI